jgi:hypothetical protein
MFLLFSLITPNSALWQKYKQLTGYTSTKSYLNKYSWLLEDFTVNGQRFWVCILRHHLESDDQFLMMETETVSEKLDSKSILTRLMTQGGFMEYVRLANQLNKGSKINNFY